jgi:hypothetical protein
MKGNESFAFYEAFECDGRLVYKSKIVFLKTGR